MENNSTDNNSMDKPNRATRKSRRAEEMSRNNLQNIQTNSRSRSRSPVTANSSNIPSNSSNGPGNRHGDQMTPLTIDYEKKADEYNKVQKAETDMVLEVYRMCQALEKTVADQQKSIKKLQEEVDELKNSRCCSKCQKSLDNKKSFCSACVCEW